MASLLKRVAVLSARRRGLVIGVWLIAAVGLVYASNSAGTRYNSGVEVASSDSGAANDMMARSFSSRLSDSSPIVFHTDQGKLTDAQNRRVVEASLRALSAEANVEAVTDPFASSATVSRVSRDGRTAYSTMVPSTALGDLSVGEAEKILDTAAAPARGTGVQVEASGPLGTKISRPETRVSELVGIAAAMAILLVVFGTIPAMGLPIVIAIFGLVCGRNLVSLLSHLVTVPDIAPTVATMIGLGVGIDYSLFIITRFRAARFEGMSVPDAIGFAASTSGRAVAYAGGTVIIALLALAVSGVSIVTAIGEASAIVVVVAVLASATLLPALLGLLGDHIESLRVGRDKRPTLGHSRFWQAWGERLARRPGTFAAVSVIVLVVVASPLRALELGLRDESSAPRSSTVRQANDLLTNSFGAGTNGPLLVMADVRPSGAPGQTDPRLVKLQQGLSAADGVQAVAAPQVSNDGTTAMVVVLPAGLPASDTTKDLVSEVRDHVIPATGLDAHVGGSTAQQLDVADLISKRLPLSIAVVVGLSMLLLLLAFRSAIVPLQAALLNLLAVGAAYGVLTAVFQQGHGATLIGLDGAIPIVMYVPILMFAILFGLAMDYQVFFLSEVREDIDAKESPRQAVIDGLAGTGKVIASAAAIMVAVFASFILNGYPVVKEFGVGLASAILIAGSMACVLLPAVIMLTGRHEWTDSSGESDRAERVTTGV